MTAGYHRIHSWDSGLGETRADVERNLSQMTEVDDQLGKSGDGHVGVARTSQRRTEMAFILSVWEELQTDVKVMREIKAKNKQMTEVQIISVPSDERLACENAYNATNMHALLPLTDALTPHKDMWGLAHTLRLKNGHMPCLQIGQCRLKGEHVTKIDKVVTDSLDNLKVLRGGDINLWTDVTVGTEIIARRHIFWILAHFMRELELPIGLQIQHANKDWILDKRPMSSTILAVDKTIMKKIGTYVSDRVTRAIPGRPPAACNSFREAVQFVIEELPMIYVESFQDTTGPDRGFVSGSGDLEIKGSEGYKGPVDETGAPLQVQHLGQQQGDSSGVNKGSLEEGANNSAIRELQNNIKSLHKSIKGLGKDKKGGRGNPGGGGRKGGDQVPGDPFKGNSRKALIRAKKRVPGGPGAAPKGDGAKGGKDKGKGTGKDGKKSRAMTPSEAAWFGQIKNWWNRCKFWNAGCGCARDKNCAFDHKCVLCGGGHRIIDQHSDKEFEPWA